MRVLVTGAGGFVGRAVRETLAGRGYAVRAAVRRAACASGEDVVVVGEIDGQTDWSSALAGVECVVHLAARVHVMHETAAHPLAEFRRVNVAGTERLARAAAQTGVSRFLFLSSVKVIGEETIGRSFSEADPPQPEDAYGRSKWEAEQALQEIARETGLEVVVLRPPLVYGPRVKGNFYSLLRAVASGFPLPLGAIDNRRSLLYLGNLSDAIWRCLSHPAAAGQTFLVSDGQPVSTTELVRQAATVLGMRARLARVPPGWLELAGRVVGRHEAIRRLTRSLELDSSKIRRTLGWEPPYSMAQGLRKTAAWYLGGAGRGEPASSAD